MCYGSTQLVEDMLFSHQSALLSELYGPGNSSCSRYTPSQFADIGRVKTLRRSLRGYELEPAELASENSFHYKAEYVELVFETS